MKKKILFLICCLFAGTIFSKEFLLNDKEEVFSFGRGLIGVQCDRGSASVCLRQINLQLEETKKIKLDLGEGKWTFNYEILGNRFLVETYNKKLDVSDIYLYDTTLTLISRKKLTQEQIRSRYTRIGSTDSKFDMAEYYNRKTFMLSNAILPCDKFIDDGLLYLKCDESLMRTIPGGITNAAKVIDKNSRVVIYRLIWGNNDGSFPVNFDVKWSVKLPMQSVLGYRFYTYGKNGMFLYLVSIDGGEMKSFYYKLNPETGEIIWKKELKLSNGAVPWASSSYYDQQTDNLFIIGNYQNELREKETFDGYFISSVDKNGDVKYVQKPFPTLPENGMPNYWQKNPMLVADHFVKGNSGSYTCICSYCFSFEQTGNMGKQGEPIGGGSMLVIAAIVLLDFDITLAKVDSKVFMFNNYDKNAPPNGYYGSTVFQVMNRFSLIHEGLHPQTSDMPGTGITEMICLNTVEEYNTLKSSNTLGFYVFSTATGAEMKKSFDYAPGGKTELRGNFSGLPGEMVWHQHSSEKGDYLEIVKMHL